MIAVSGYQKPPEPVISTTYKGVAAMADGTGGWTMANGPYEGFFSMAEASDFVSHCCSVRIVIQL